MAFGVCPLMSAERVRVRRTSILCVSVSLFIQFYIYAWRVRRPLSEVALPVILPK